MQSVIWKIGGEAGFGIMSAGNMLARVFSRQGYHIFATNEYPSLIRGGHNLITLRVGCVAFESMNRGVHVLVALNKETVGLHAEELSSGSLVVFDPTNYNWNATELPKDVKLTPVPLTELLTKVGGVPVMRNTVALGASLALLGADFSHLEKMITEQFKRKGDAVVSLNIAVARSGYDYVRTTYPNETSVFLDKPKSTDKLLVMNGSEAFGVGAVRAGLKFAAIYPMTPINSLISFLADHEKQLSIVYMQPEDEIAGINMALGASLMGVRSMVATSGGGFSLMVEGVSLSGIMELPVVIDLGMRVGPATGMPTWTEQGELQFVIHAGHGEFARIVLAPADAEQTYSLVIAAFNLADKYHIPVFVLTDKYLNESQWAVRRDIMEKDVPIERGKLLLGKELTNDPPYKRYNLDTPDGVSARSVPGQKHGFFVSNSYEHDEIGMVTEDPHNRRVMVEKRLKKFKAISSDVVGPSVYGDTEADLTLVCWGTTRGPVIDAMNLLRSEGKKVRVIHYSWMYPFPSDKTKELLRMGGRTVDIEQNSTGQLAQLIAEHCQMTLTEKLLKYDGRPFYPEEIVELLS